MRISINRNGDCQRTSVDFSDVYTLLGHYKTIPTHRMFYNILLNYAEKHCIKIPEGLDIAVFDPKGNHFGSGSRGFVEFIETWIGLHQCSSKDQIEPRIIDFLKFVEDALGEYVRETVRWRISVYRNLNIEVA